MQNPNTKSPIIAVLFRLLPWLILSVTFVVDCFTPLNFVMWAPYLLAIVLSTFNGNRAIITTVTGVAAALTLLGAMFASTQAGDLGPTNRIFGAGMIGLCGVLCLRLDRLLKERQAAVHRLKELNETLEKWIDERTDELRHSQERLRLALEASSDGLWDWNIATGEVYFSTRWCETLGYKREELKQRIGTWEQLVHPDDLPRVLETLNAYIEGKTAVYECENRLRMKSGNYRWNLDRGKIVARNEEGKPLRMIGIDADITERKLSEEKLRFYAAELQERNQELIRSNQELDEFAYVASHDLKEPLRGIHNFAQFLLEDYSNKLDGAGQEKLQTLIKLSKRLEALIDSLHQYSRVGRVELALVPTDVHKLVEEILDSLHFAIDEAGVEVRIPERLPEVTCDHVRIGEVFRNLITNAIKYNDKSQKWIEIGFTKATPPAFYVRDNGIGIRDRHCEAIFRMFKRLHGRDEYGGGTGVGLTIVKKIIERHGGRVWIESTFGEGTAFYFTLASD